MPNFIDYYTLEKLAGPSIGKRQMSICPGKVIRTIKNDYMYCGRITD